MTHLRTRDNVFELDFSELHERTEPVDVRSQDNVHAKIRRRGSESFSKAVVWRTSERAIELVSDDEFLEKGTAVDLELIVSGQRLYYEGLIVNSEQANNRTRRVGIRYARQVEKWADTERRGSARWLCEEQCHPICVVSSPFIMGRPTLLRIKDISESGIRMTCSIQATYLVPQLRVSSMIELPTVGNFHVHMDVVRVDFEREHGKDVLSIGARFVELEKRQRNLLAQYLIEYSSVVSLQALKESGFDAPSPRRGVTFYFAKSESDIRQVMKLRHTAHVHANNLKQDHQSVEETGFYLADKVDENCRIAVGVYKEEVIATARIHFGVLSEPLEHEAYVEFDESFPRRDQVVEVSRLAIDPRFQSGDILVGMFQFIGTTCIRPAQPYILISSWEHAVPRYERIGFRKTGHTHREHHWAHNECVMIMNGVDAFFGKGVHPFAWGVMWKDVVDSWIESNTVTPKGLNRYRYRLYKLISLFAVAIEKLRNKPRMRS